MTEPSTGENFSVRVVHDAPCALVFEVMTRPEHLTHFWGPTGTHTPLAGIVVDLRPGGAFETTMVNNADAGTFTMRAVYLDVEPPEYLSWREVESGVITEITFTALDEHTTEVVTTQRGVPPHRRTPQAQAGWRTALDRNAAYLAILTTRESP